MGILEEIREEVAALMQVQRELLEALAQRNIGEWLNLEQCCQLKGIAHSTVEKHRWMQPPNPHTVGRRTKWHRSEVLPWLTWTDERCMQNWETRRRRGGAAA